jgi:hypothetical protein
MKGFIDDFSLNDWDVWFFLLTKEMLSGVVSRDKGYESNHGASSATGLPFVTGSSAASGFETTPVVVALISRGGIASIPASISGLRCLSLLSSSFEYSGGGGPATPPLP